MFVILTDLSGQRIRFNVAAVDRYYAFDGGACLDRGLGAVFVVQESPEEIDDLICAAGGILGHTNDHTVHGTAARTISELDADGAGS